MALDLTNAQSFKDYVESRNYELFSRMYFGRKMQEIATAHLGVKGKKPLTELELPSEMAKRWIKTFEDNDIAFSPVVLETHRAKVDLKIYPQELESSYLGELRKRGQSVTDFPFQAYVMERIIAKIGQEAEIAMMQGVQTGAPANSDKLKVLFDGYLEILDAQVTATNLTAYSPGAGEKVYESCENMVAALDPEFQEGELVALMSNATWRTFAQEYRTDFGQGIGNQITDGFPLDTAPNCRVHAIPGMGSDTGIIVTPRMNFHYGIDDPSDSMSFDFEQEDRSLKFWADFMMGVQMLWTDDASGAIQYKQ